MYTRNKLWKYIYIIYRNRCIYLDRDRFVYCNKHLYHFHQQQQQPTKKHIICNTKHRCIKLKFLNSLSACYLLSLPVCWSWYTVLKTQFNAAFRALLKYNWYVRHNRKISSNSTTKRDIFSWLWPSFFTLLLSHIHNSTKNKPSGFECQYIDLEKKN